MPCFSCSYLPPHSGGPKNSQSSSYSYSNGRTAKGPIRARALSLTQPSLLSRATPNCPTQAKTGLDWGTHPNPECYRLFLLWSEFYVRLPHGQENRDRRFYALDCDHRVVGAVSLDVLQTIGTIRKPTDRHSTPSRRAFQVSAPGTSPFVRPVLADPATILFS